MDPEVPNSVMTVAALPSHSRLNRHFPRNKIPNPCNHRSVHHENRLHAYRVDTSKAYCGVSQGGIITYCRLQRDVERVRYDISTRE